MKALLSDLQVLQYILKELFSRIPIENAEEKLEKYLARESLVKTQVIMSVTESLALMLQKMTVQEVWEALDIEMTKKMVIPSLRHQLKDEERRTRWSLWPLRQTVVE